MNIGGGFIPYPDREGSTAPPTRENVDQGMAMHPANLNKGDMEKASYHRGKPVVGLLRSKVAGRTDRLPIEVLEDSYVIPADVVSGWGQGNTEAGAKILDQMFGSHHDQGHKMADGGYVPRKISIVAAGGEYIVHPSAIRSFGGGDMQKGHKILDKMVKSKRMATAKHMQKLPGPRND